MRHIDIVTCRWLSPEWASFIRQGYQTALHDNCEPYIAVMWRGSAARDMVRNIPAVQWPEQFRKQTSQEQNPC